MLGEASGAGQRTVDARRVGVGAQDAAEEARERRREGARRVLDARGRRGVAAAPGGGARGAGVGAAAGEEDGAGEGDEG
ncbi:MAG: hypothetical protein CVU56_22495, partial [Deltaproteobacteria bacterium HGW-Deltaproteobacteria-14]